MINLNKGERFNLSKDGKALSLIRVGLRWDPAGSNEQSGLLSRLFSSKKTSEQDIDIDASVFMLNDGKLKSHEDLVYYGKLHDKDRSVIHCGDNLTGEGEEGVDDEVIRVALNKVPEKYTSLLFVVNIYDCDRRKQHFGMIKNASVKLYDDITNEELASFKLSDDYDGKTAIHMGEVYRRNGEWKFKAIGEAYCASGLSAMSQRLA